MLYSIEFIKNNICKMTFNSKHAFIKVPMYTDHLVIFVPSHLEFFF